MSKPQSRLAKNDATATRNPNPVAAMVAGFLVSRNEQSRERSEAPEVPKVGQAELGGLKVAFVVLAPGMQLPAEYQGRPVDWTQLSGGGWLAMVYGGLTVRAMDRIDDLNQAVQGAYPDSEIDEYDVQAGKSWWRLTGEVNEAFPPAYSS